MGTAEPDRMHVLPENRGAAAKCDGALAVLEGLGQSPDASFLSADVALSLAARTRFHALGPR